jgi:hypothetical protein
MRPSTERNPVRPDNRHRTALRVEPLEDRVTPSWAGIPPSLLALPGNPPAVSLNASGYATGSAAISSGEVDWYRFTVKAGTTCSRPPRPRAR